MLQNWAWVWVYTHTHAHIHAHIHAHTHTHAHAHVGISEGNTFPPGAILFRSDNNQETFTDYGGSLWGCCRKVTVGLLKYTFTASASLHRFLPTL